MPEEPSPSDDRDDASSEDVSSEDVRSRTVDEVLRHEAAREQARLQGSRKMKKQERRGIGLRHVVFLLALASTLYVWLAAPSWAGVERPPEPTPAHREASLRLAIYLQAQRVEGHRDRTGELPESLDETGPPLPGLRYTKTPRGTYHLEGRNDTLVLFYSSSSVTPLSEFLGTGEELVSPTSAGDG